MAEAMHIHGEAMVKLKSAMMTGALACALGLVAPQISHAQGATPSSGGGQSQVGNGNGVPSSPRTQGTTDKAGQTPQVPGGRTTDQPPTGSVGVDPRIPTNSGEQNREPNADTSRDQNGNDRSKTIDRNTGATANEVDQNDPNDQSNQNQAENPDKKTPGTRQGTSGTGTVGTSGTQNPNGAASGQTDQNNQNTSGTGNNGATGSAGSGTNSPSSGSPGTTPNGSGAGGSGAAGSGSSGAGSSGTPGAGGGATPRE
jgi:hypothetical protein